MFFANYFIAGLGETAKILEREAGLRLANHSTSSAITSLQLTPTTVSLLFKIVLPLHQL